jgi:hypothetical protein
MLLTTAETMNKGRACAQIVLSAAFAFALQRRVFYAFGTLYG